MIARLLALLATSFALLAGAGPIQLVRDINRTVNLPNMNPLSSAPLGGGWITSFCIGSFSGCELWFTDGTSAGTHQVKKLSSGGTDPNPRLFTAIGPYVYFVADTSDSSSAQLWRTDGTEGGTVALVTYAFDAIPGTLVASGSILYSSSQYSPQVWRTDGTQAGTFKLADMANVFPREIASAGGVVFFRGAATQLWRTDGTLAGTGMVKDLNPGVVDGNPMYFTAVGSRLFFIASDGAGRNLWTSDGTAAGTQALTSSGIGDGPASRLVTWNGKVAFITAIGGGGLLWQSDGTVAGTSSFVLPGFVQVGSTLRPLAVAGGSLYFAVGDSATGAELWKTDGTTPPHIVVDLNAGPANAVFGDIVAAGDVVYFRATVGGVTGLWRSGALDNFTAEVQHEQDLFPRGAFGDRLVLGTAANRSAAWIVDSGIAKLLSPAPGQPNNSSLCFPYDEVMPARVGNIVLFPADDAVHGCEMWRSDGTPAGTFVLKDIRQGPLGSLSSFVPIATAGNFAYFVATDESGPALWKSDGSEAGTVLLQRYPESSAPSLAASATIGSTLYFTINGALWKTDGTLQGTVKLAQQETQFFGLVAGTNRLFFIGNSSTGLWTSDGTVAGTRLVKSFPIGLGQLMVAGNIAMVGAYDAIHGFELWRSDGTAAGTFMVTDTAPGGDSGSPTLVGTLGNSLVFSSYQGSPGDYRLFITDGTLAGTRRLADLQVIFPRPAVTVGGKLYFNSGSTLYRTDGTPEGTVAVMNFDGGYASPSDLTAGPGTLFFTAGADNELWASSGTPAGTVQLDDFNPSGGLPRLGQDQRLNAIVLPSGLFFITSSLQTGFEPYFVAFDPIADAIAFAPKAGVATNGTAVSDAVPVTGINIPAAVVATGGEFCVSSGTTCSCDVAPYAGTGFVNFGQYLCVRHSTPSLANTQTTTNLFVGGVVTSFTSITSATNPPQLQFRADAFRVGEAGPVIQVPVHRVGSPAEAVTVTWTTQNGLGTVGNQFGTPGSSVQPTGVLTWAAGDTADKIITVGPGAMVPVIDDISPFPPIPTDAAFFLVLSNPTGGAALGSPASAGIRVNDNENRLGFGGGNLTVYESGPNVELWVVRDGSLSGPSTVNWTAANGTAIAGADYGSGAVPPSGTITFADGEFMKAIVIGPVAAAAPYIPIVHDGVTEADETFTVTLSSPTGASLTSNTTMTVTIYSEEGQLKLGASTASVAENFAYVDIAVNRVGTGHGFASVSYTTVDGTAIGGTHYAPVSGTFEWSVGDTSARFIHVPIINNFVLNPARTFQVRLSNAAGATLASPTTATVTITDDDCLLTFTSATATVTEGTPTLTLQVTRTGLLTDYAFVSWHTNDGTAIAGSDFGTPGHASPSGGQLVWNPNESAAKTITIPIINDTIPEGAKTFTVSLENPGSSASLGAIPVVNVTLNDDDAGVMFASPSYTVSESAGSVTLTVNRVATSGIATTVTWTAVNGTATAGLDFMGGRSGAPLKGTLSWAAGDTTPKTFSIPILNDTLTEGDEAFTVVLGTPSTGTSLATPSTATVTITDDEIAPETEFLIDTTKIVVVENGPAHAPIRVDRLSLPGRDFSRAAGVKYATVAGTALAGSDFTTASGTLIWGAGDNTPRFIPMPAIVGDAMSEAPKKFSIVLSDASPGSRIAAGEVIVTILDDDELFPPPSFGSPWTNPAPGATAGWRVSNDPGAFEGVRTLRTPTLGDNETSQFQLARTFSGGSVTFRVRISSEEGFDFLRFYVDGVKKGEWSGTTNTLWQSFSTPLAAGAHTLRWSYEKDGSVSMGEDAAWIDAVSVPASMP